MKAIVALKLFSRKMNFKWNQKEQWAQKVHPPQVSSEVSQTKTFQCHHLGQHVEQRGKHQTASCKLVSPN